MAPPLSMSVPIEPLLAIIGLGLALVTIVLYLVLSWLVSEPKPRA